MRESHHLTNAAAVSTVNELSRGVASKSSGVPRSLLPVLL